MKCPCKGCGRRTVTCHGFCQSYKEWKEWHDGVNEQARKAGNQRELSREHRLKWWKNMKWR